MWNITPPSRRQGSNYESMQWRRKKMANSYACHLLG
jgi:hypothetical protein